VPNEEKKIVLEVPSTWTLINVRNEVSMLLGTNLFQNFSFHIVQDGNIQEEVCI